MNTGLSSYDHSPISRFKGCLAASVWWRVLVVGATLVAAVVLGLSPTRFHFLLLIATSVGVVIITQDVQRLLLLFPAVALLAPFQISTGTDVSLNAAVLGAVGLVAYGVVQSLLRRTWHSTSSRLYPPLIALAAVSILALLTGNMLWDLNIPRPPNLLLIQIGQLTIYFLSFVIAWFTATVVVDRTGLRRMTYAVLITGGGSMILVLLDHLFALPLRLNAVTLNMFTVWLMPMLLSQASYDKNLTTRQRGLLIGICFLSGIVIARIWFIDGNWVGGWFPPFLALGLFLWFRYPKLRGVVILVTVVLTFVVGLEPFLQVLDFDLEQKWDISGGSRLTLWRSIIELTAPRPLLGLGIAAYRHYHFYKPLAYGGALWTRPTVSAHNMFVDLFAQMGILGLTCYLWFLIEALLLSCKLYRGEKGFAQGYALVAFCVLVGTLAADLFAATSLPFVYNVGFHGFRASVVHWMLLGGLVVLENQHEIRAEIG